MEVWGRGRGSARDRDDEFNRTIHGGTLDLC
jgi:hypothetical protein